VFQGFQGLQGGLTRVAGSSREGVQGFQGLQGRAYKGSKVFKGGLTRVAGSSGKNNFVRVVGKRGKGGDIQGREEPP